MKKISLFLLLIVFSFACSFSDFVTAPTATPGPPATVTLTPPPTDTPLPPSPTFTTTPTLVGFKEPTATSIEPTATEVVSVTPLVMITPNTTTPTLQMDGFIFINTSLAEFYKGNICEPFTVKITAQILDRDAVKYVLLFARFKSTTAERYGKWTSIPMETIGAGTYVHDLTSDQVKEDEYFQNAWLEYQIVATNAAGAEIGRSAIFKDRIKMLACIPTDTPTPATVKP